MSGVRGGGDFSLLHLSGLQVDLQRSERVAEQAGFALVIVITLISLQQRANALFSACAVALLGAFLLAQPRFAFLSQSCEKQQNLIDSETSR